MVRKSKPRRVKKPKTFTRHQVRLGKDFRNFFLDSMRNVPEDTPLLFSGGVDSTTILFAAMTLGWKPNCYTIQLGETESPDVKAAKKIAKSFNLNLKIIKIPRNEENLIKDIKHLLAVIKYPKKAYIQCSQPYIYLSEALSDDGFDTALHGVTADMLYGNTQKMLINRCHNDKHWWDNQRNPLSRGYDTSEDEQKRVAAVNGVSLIDPYFDEDFVEFMLARTWEELNTPRMKMIAILGFSEYWKKGAFYRNPMNMQVGSGIREWHDTLLKSKYNTKGSKAILGVYNEFIKNYKPDYIPLTMKEVKAAPNVYEHEYTAVSTFSGAGGSCLGLKLAGFNVLWANEFIPDAQETYRANHKDTILNTNDIRNVTADDIFEATGLRKGELDLFEGSPPCAAFSTAGKRDKGWGEKKKYSSNNTCQVVDDLFFEYSRLLGDLQPKTFIAENVEGLVKGTAKGYFKLIMKELKSKGYTVEARIINSLNLGVPQTRKRLIFVGVRDDLGFNPSFPEPLPYTYNVEDAIPDFTTKKYYPKPKKIADLPPEEWCYHLPNGKLHDLWKATNYKRKSAPRLCDAAKKIYNQDAFFTHFKLNPKAPSPTILQTLCHYHPIYPRSLNIAEIKRICTFPDDFILTGKSVKVRWERIGRAVPPRMMYHIALAVRLNVLDSYYRSEEDKELEIKKEIDDKEFIDIDGIDIDE